MLPEGDAWLLVEFGGETLAEAEGKARALMQAHAPFTIAQEIYLGDAEHLDA